MNKPENSMQISQGTVFDEIEKEKVYERSRKSILMPEPLFDLDLNQTNQRERERERERVILSLRATISNY